MTTILRHPFYCRLSGVQLGVLEYPATIGHPAYVKSWQDTILVHPVFNMPRGKQLAFARGEYKRLAKAAVDGQATDTEEVILRVCFLAVLHSLGSVVQDLPALPPLHVVQTNMEPLFKLAYWHHVLDSSRFRFPKYKISKQNANSDFLGIADYLEVCFSIKTMYEAGKVDKDEQAKLDAATRAAKLLRDTWIKPVSTKQLWAWVRANLPAKYEADAQGWMATIFLGGERAILSFDKDEIQLLDDIVQTECPMGTGMMKLAREHLDYIMQVYKDNKEAFEVNFDDYDEELGEDGIAKIPAVLVAPQMKDFTSKVEFIKANALFYLQSRARAAKPGSAAGSL